MKLKEKIMAKFNSLIGNRYGSLEVIQREKDRIYYSKVQNRNHIDVQYLCKCDCGQEVIKSGKSLKVLKNPTCGGVGCSPVKDLTNNVINKIKVLKFSNRDMNGVSFWTCKCRCSKEFKVNHTDLTHGNIKSCGCFDNPTEEEKNKNKQASNRLPEGKSNFNSLFSRYKYNAKNRNLKWELSEDKFREITSSNCHYCGVEPKTKTHTSGKKPTAGYYIYNGIDRADNNLGYIIDNTLPCCSDCNYSKQDMGYQEFIDHILKITNHLKLKE